VEERGPKVVANCGMVVRGPIVPVSSLDEVSDGLGQGMREGEERYPNNAPPKEMSVAC
jgi:hypothetical protein